MNTITNFWMRGVLAADPTPLCYNVTRSHNF